MRLGRLGAIAPACPGLGNWCVGDDNFVQAIAIYGTLEHSYREIGCIIVSVVPNH